MSAPEAEGNAAEICAKCGSGDNTVVDSRTLEFGRRRRRRCQRCRHRWSTVEVPLDFAQAAHRIMKTLDDTARLLVDLACDIDTVRAGLPKLTATLSDEDAKQ
jgi:hypothetical protein